MGKSWRMGVAALAMGLVTAVWGAIPTPSAAEIAKVTEEVKSNDAATIDAGVKQIDSWLTAGWVGRDIFATSASTAGWLPILLGKGRNQEVADLSLKGILFRPAPEAISLLIELRAKAFTGLNKPKEALEASKQYFNTCDARYMSRQGMDLLTTSLQRLRPEDPTIGTRFRSEVTRAASGGEKSLLKTVMIDVKPYERALGIWKTKTAFKDRVAYGNLLLATDQGAEAMTLFRELYQVATTPEELTMAVEGIGKALRTEDGNLARANAWMSSPEAKDALAVVATRATSGATTRVILP